MMPNQYIIVFICLIFCLLTSCKERECEVFEWIGEYHQISEECDEPGTAFDTIFIISDGFGDNTLMLNNGFFDVVGCEAEIANLATLELNEDELIARGFGCTAVFQRQ